MNALPKTMLDSKLEKLSWIILEIETTKALCWLVCRRHIIEGSEVESKKVKKHKSFRLDNSILK